MLYTRRPHPNSGWPTCLRLCPWSPPVEHNGQRLDALRELLYRSGPRWPGETHVPTDDRRDPWDGRCLAARDVPSAVDAVHPQVHWLEAEHSPHTDRNPYCGPLSVVSGVFGRLSGEWEDVDFRW